MDRSRYLGDQPITRPSKPLVATLVTVSPSALAAASKNSFLISANVNFSLFSRTKLHSQAPRWNKYLCNCHCGIASEPVIVPSATTHYPRRVVGLAGGGRTRGCRRVCGQAKLLTQQSQRTNPDRPRRAPENESHAVRRRNSLSTKIPKRFEPPTLVEYRYIATYIVANSCFRRSSTPHEERRLCV